MWASSYGHICVIDRYGKCIYAKKVYLKRIWSKTILCATIVGSNNFCTHCLKMKIIHFISFDVCVCFFYLNQSNPKNFLYAKFNFHTLWSPIACGRRCNIPKGLPFSKKVEFCVESNFSFHKQCRWCDETNVIYRPFVCFTAIFYMFTKSRIIQSRRRLKVMYKKEMTIRSPFASRL